MTATIARIGRSDTWRRAFIAQHGARCHYCNRAGSLDEGPGQRPWHVDHMTPLARGGEDADENLTLACKRCNLTKSAQEYDTFRRFARAAWWQDRDGIDDGELDAVMEQWEATAVSGRGRLVGGRWWESRDSDGHLLVVDAGVQGPGGDDATALLQTAYRSGKEDRAAIDFILAAHRLIPDLVSEIRQLRADLREQEIAA